MFFLTNARHLRRFFMPLIATVLAMGALVGCAKSEDVPPPPKYKGTLTLWVSKGLAGYHGGEIGGDFFAERAKAFEVANKGIAVQVRSFPTPAALEEAIGKGPAPGEAQADLVFGRLLKESPKLSDPTPLLTNKERADYLPNGFDGFKRGANSEQTVGLPVLLEAQALALNSQVFADANVPLPQGGTWAVAEFENSLKKLSGNGRYGLGFYDTLGYHEWWPLANGVIAAHTAAVAPQSEDGFNRLVSYRNQGWLHPDTAKLTAAETWALFAKGKFAIMPVGPWAVPLLRKEPYNVKVAVAAFPGSMTVGYTYGFTFPDQGNQQKLQAAVALAQFVAAPDQQVRLSRMTGLLPARKSAGNPFTGDPEMSRIYAMAAQQQPLPAGSGWDQAEAQFYRPLRFALLGAREPKAALDETQKIILSAIAPALK